MNMVGLERRRNLRFDAVFLWLRRILPIKKAGRAGFKVQAARRSIAIDATVDDAHAVAHAQVIHIVLDDGAVFTIV